MKKKKMKSFTLGFMFILIIWSLLIMGVSYSHWEEPMQISISSTTTTWEDNDPHYLIAYEDTSNPAEVDYDYNDFIVEVNCESEYLEGNLIGLEFIFTAVARGSMNTHAMFLEIPEDVFGCSGTYTIWFYDHRGVGISTHSGSFSENTPIHICIFQNTKKCFTSTLDQEYYINTIDGTGIHNGDVARVSFTFDDLFAMNTPQISGLPEINCHGDNLFFSLNLHNLNTREQIILGSDLVIVTPKDWQWPEEITNLSAAHIWEVYPYNPGNQEGVSQGTPPIFSDIWYEEDPTMFKWDP